MDIHTIIAMGRQTGCSDIHLSEGLPMLIRVKGTLVYAPIQPGEEETRQMILQMPDACCRRNFRKEKMWILPYSRRMGEENV